MFQKLTKQERENKQYRLYKLRNELQEEKIIKLWKLFYKSPIAEQMEIRRQWNEYYKKVWEESPVAQIFREQWEAFKRNDFARVKELADQVRQMRENGDIETIAKPLSHDPFDYDFGIIVREYNKCLYQISEFEKMEDKRPEDTEEERNVWKE